MCGRIYLLTDPNNPNKKRTFSINQNLKANIDYKELDEILHKLVLDGNIKNRTHLIEQLKQKDILITRESKDYLSIKLPNHKKAKRFKGGIYNESFKELGDIERSITKREQELRSYDTRDTQAITKELEQRLNQLISKKAIYNKERYTPRDKPTKSEFKASNQIKQSEVSSTSIDSSSRLHSSTNDREHNSNIILEKQKLDNTTKPKSYNQQSKFYEDLPSSNLYTKKHQIQIYKNRRLEYDTIRESFISRDTAVKRKQQQAKQYFSKTRAGILQSVKESNNRIYNTTKQPSSNYIQNFTNELKQSISKLTTAIKRFSESIKNFGRKSIYIDDIEEEFREF